MDPKETYDELLDLLVNNLAYLPDKPEENPRSTLHTLWYFCCGSPKSTKEAYRSSLPELNSENLYRLKELIDKRIQGTPLAHLTGIQEFMGLNFTVDACALIPRKETEILGYAALKKIQHCALNQPVVHVIDVCTGMGNLALAFAAHESRANILAADISEEAVALAKKNASLLSLERQVDFFTGDLFGTIDKERWEDSIDVVTCNPPYISTHKLEQMPREIIRYEPKEAFDGGIYGLGIIFRLLREAIPFLKDGGWLCFEVGLGQGEQLTRIMERNPTFKSIQQAKDKKGNVRAILAQISK